MQRSLISVALGLGVSALAHPSGLKMNPAIDDLGTVPQVHRLSLKKTLELTLAAYPVAVNASTPMQVIPAHSRNIGLKMTREFSGGKIEIPTGLDTGVKPDFFLGAQPPRKPAIAALLEQSRFWSSQARDDLAEEMLTKLFRIAPDNLAGLEALARIKAHRRQPEAARTILARMRRLKPNSVEQARTAALLRVEHDDRDALNTLRLQARNQQFEAAAAAMHALYPYGPPTEEMTLEYWRLVANAPNGKARARAGLEQLMRQEPQNIRYQLARDELLSTSTPIDRMALARIIALADNQIYAKPARTAWRRAMLALDAQPFHITLLQRYLTLEPTDSAVKAHLVELQTAPTSRPKQQNEPLTSTRDVASIERAAAKNGSATLALHQAQQANNQDIESINTKALLRLRQHRYAESEALFLRAAHLDKAHKARWQRMANIAHYWGLITEADIARSKNVMTVAEEKLRAAHALDPKEPTALLGLGSLYAAQLRTNDAEHSYQQVLVIEPHNISALEGLIKLHLTRGGDDQLQPLLSKLTPAQRTALMPTVNRTRAARMRTEADSLVSAGNSSGAITLLEQALPLAPQDPWIRFDLAKLYLQRKTPVDAQRADDLFNALLKQLPNDPGALYASALLDSSRDHLAQALATLERLPPKTRDVNRIELQRRVWVAIRLRSAVIMADHGEIESARALLIKTAEAVCNDPKLTPEIDVALTNLDIKLITREVAARQQTGDQSGALAIVQQAAAKKPDQRQLQMLYADTALAMHAYTEAESGYRHVLQQRPNDQVANLGLIDILIATGQPAAAQSAIEHQLSFMKADSTELTPDEAASFSSRWIDLENDEAALALITPALAKSPNNERLLNQGAEIAERSNQPDQAINFLQRALAASATTQRSVLSQLSAVVADVSSADARLDIDTGTFTSLRINLGQPLPPTDGHYEKLAQLLDARSSWVSGAVDHRSRSGSGGKSNYRYSESPFEFKRPLGSGRQLFVQAAAVATNNGSLELSATNDAATLGSLVLCQPLCNQGPVAQTATGLGVTTGVEQRGVRADIGITPIGFPIQNIVGGVLQKGDIGPLGYSLDVARRAVTGSVLSYAGSRDLRTGEKWGGVLTNGATLNLSLDKGGALGVWSSLGLHKLTGTNVKTNNRVQLMGGSYWRIVNQSDQLLSVGITGLHWRFSDNLGEYTFGHGGYYSPAQFNSISLPVTFGQRTARWSYLIRGAVSRSHSSTAQADYFPTRSDFQTQALALSAINGIDPRYSASTGHGVGRSLSGTLEYQLHPTRFIGTRFEIDRSTDYAPNRLLFYFRVLLDRDSSARPVMFPPEAPISASQY
jgi:predicted Zn-dependent protease